MQKLTKQWWRERFVTLMVIPERTRRVHKVIIPFVLVKLGVVLCSLSVVFLLMMGMDYIHVLGRMAENKALKGENFKLRQELQQVRNKVDSMESTIERVRNYAKKLQMLTGQGDKNAVDLPWGGPGESMDREPSREVPPSKDKHSKLFNSEKDVEVSGVAAASLMDRVERLQNVSFNAESNLSRLHVHLLAKSAVINATPSLIPIMGWVSSGFGYRHNPYDGSYKLHAGVDIAADPGTPVRAPADGMVIYSGYREGYGKCVVIDHGYGIRTLFAHASKLYTNTAVKVKRGEMIAQVGSTGHSTGPHLHYEVRKNGVPVNPATFFARPRF